MPNSYAQKIQITCTKTQQPFEFEVWLIIDREERPDLIQRVKDGNLHTIISPYTHEELGNVDAPLLIFQPNHTPPLLFSPAEQNQQQATGLIQRLRKTYSRWRGMVRSQRQSIGFVQQLRGTLGTSWDDTWLESSLPIIPRSVIGEVLIDFDHEIKRLEQNRNTQPSNDIRSILRELDQPAHSAQDMPRRIELCQRVLELLAKEGNEKLWAAIQNGLGNSLAQNPLGRRADNLEQAIQSYNNALQVYTREAFPEQWANTQNNLALAYRNRIRGERADNLEQAIESLNDALQVYTREAFPEQWAMTQNNLATAYRNRIRGERADNLEQAIQSYNNSLQIRTREAFPEQWAMTQNNLAIAYSSRIRGERADNLEQSIQSYNNALLVYTREAFPEQWSMTQNNLALAYSDRIRGERADNLEQAIQFCNNALLVYTREAFPANWAMTQNNLANAYANRIHEERANNLEQSIQSYNNALQVFTREAFPEQWAMTQNNLANAYRDRISGERADNLEQAIQSYNNALQVRTCEAFPEQWANTQNNLANTYVNRIRGERADNLEQSIQSYNNALRVYTREAFLEQWAMTQNNLANAYRERIIGERTDNLEQAIQSYNNALQVYTCEDFPADWAMTQNNLANAYRDRISGERADNLEQAIQSYNNALHVRIRESFPIDHLQTLSNLANLYFDERDWKEAYQIYLDVIAVGLDIFTIATGDAGRLDAIKKTSDAYNHAVYSAVQLGNYSQALTHLEAGKARLLAEAQALADSNLNQLNHDEREHLQTLRDQIKALEYEARLSDDHPARREYLTITADLGKSRQEIRQFVGTLRAKYPDFMPEGLSLDTLLNTIPVDGALVAPLFTTHGSIIFVVPSGIKEVTNEHVLFMDDFKRGDLGAISREKDNQPGWLRYYVNHRFGQTKTDSLLDGITDVTRRLWDGFIGQVHQRLQALGVKNVLLMPQGDTNLLPLHLAWREVDGLPRYFMDDYQITYTPSMVTFATARRKSTYGEGALVVGVSEYQQMNNLPNTKAEAESIATLFNTSPLLDRQATIEAVRDGVRGKAYVHLSCHGGFGWGGDACTSSKHFGHKRC